VFTGAGISAESGKPDFRSPAASGPGCRRSISPIFLASEEARRRRFALEATLRAAAPNRGHRAVAEVVRRDKAAAVITQNIDGLHQASGIAADRIGAPRFLQHRASRGIMKR
jgi:NAD-dependent deacetylase